MKKSIAFFLFIIIALAAQAQSFYHPDSIQKIEITFPQNNWDSLLRAYKDSSLNNRLIAQIRINGTFLDSVGIRYKGNSSYREGQNKKPFNIKLNHIIKGQNYQGFETLKLSNGYFDPSFLREVLSYEILRNYMPAPEANFCRLNVNGVYRGLYSNVESIDENFLKKHFNSSKNTFFKCDPIWGTPRVPGCRFSLNSSLVFMGNDTNCYVPNYQIKSNYGWEDLRDFTKDLENFNQIEKWLNVDRTLWMHAWNNVLVNFDSYTGKYMHNYYLYLDDNRRFNPIVWDLNMSFGAFLRDGISLGMSPDEMIQLTPTHHFNTSDHPLIRILLQHPAYFKRYIAHLKTIVKENFNQQQFYQRAQTLHNLIDSAVYQDSLKLYSYQAFQENLDSNFYVVVNPPRVAPGFSYLFFPRTTFLNNHSELTKIAPEIKQTQFHLLPQNQNKLAVTTEVEQSNQVEIFFRYNSKAIFEKKTMFDDGMHQDALANDGIYGVFLEPSASEIQYYIFAQNNLTGTLLPERAEYEFFSIPPSILPGELVINEILADNDTVIVDQNGEFDDWIELYNNSTENLHLGGLHISDKTNRLNKWQLPDTILPANSFLVVWADENPTQKGLHANFKLSKSGESLFISNSDTSIIDSLSFGLQNPNISLGRIPNGTGNFRKTPATFAQFNSIFSQINEISQDFEVELYPNPSRNLLVLKSNEISNASIKIYNLLGEQMAVYRFKASNKIILNVDDYASGIYLIKIADRIVKHFVKI